MAGWTCDHNEREAQNIAAWVDTLYTVINAHNQQVAARDRALLAQEIAAELRTSPAAPAMSGEADDLQNVDGSRDLVRSLHSDVTPQLND
jgi:hypothetical protein